MRRLRRWLGTSKSQDALRRRAAAARNSCTKRAQRQRALVHLVLGDLRSAAKLLAEAPGLGWSGAEHPGSLVFPRFCMWLGGVELPMEASRDFDETSQPSQHEEPRLVTPQVEELLDLAPGTFRGAERFSRHWYDLDCLSRTAYFEPALTDRELCQRVADHKQVFFRERDEGGEVVDYGDAVRGRLRLGPSGELERFLLTITTECWLTALFSKPPRISKRSSRVAARSRNAPIGNGSRA